MKKLVAALLVLAMFAPLAFANGSKEEKPTGPITLTLWTHEDANRQKCRIYGCKS